MPRGRRQAHLAILAGLICARVSACGRLDETGCRTPCARDSQGWQQPPATTAPSDAPQVVPILAKPNYRHQKKQKEQARKLRQAEKLVRRQAARSEPEAQATAITTEAPAEPTQPTR